MAQRPRRRTTTTCAQSACRTLATMRPPPSRAAGTPSALTASNRGRAAVDTGARFAARRWTAPLHLRATCTGGTTRTAPLRASSAWVSTSTTSSHGSPTWLSTSTTSSQGSSVSVPSFISGPRKKRASTAHCRTRPSRPSAHSLLEVNLLNISCASSPPCSCAPRELVPCQTDKWQTAEG